MGHQPQDARVDRATSRWWRTPVASACLKTVAVTGFAGVAWLLGGSSAAHADAVDLTGALGAGGTAVSDATTLVALPPVATATGHATSTEKIGRPLAAKALPVPRAVTAAVSSMTRNASGALAPATTPASGAVGGLRAFARNTTPALGSTVQVGTTGLGQLPSALSAGSALTGTLPTPRNLMTPIGAGHVVADAVSTVRPLHDVESVVPPLPIGGPSSLTGSQPVDALGGRIASPLQWAIPARDAARTGSFEPAQAARAAQKLDGASSPAVGASTAPTLPTPGPAQLPDVPGAGMNSGSTTSSFASQFDGSAGVIGAGGHTARLHALRAIAAAATTGVPLVRDEELAATPD
jgi:hypothetical protein